MRIHLMDVALDGSDGQLLLRILPQRIERRAAAVPVAAGQSVPAEVHAHDPGGVVLRERCGQVARVTRLAAQPPMSPSEKTIKANPMRASEAEFIRYSPRGDS